MKGLIFTVAITLAATGSIFAQSGKFSRSFPPDYKWEVGLNGGISLNTVPYGVADVYSGAQTQIAPEVSLRLNYNINEYLQVGFNLAQTNWRLKDSWNQTGSFGQNFKPQDVKIVLADPAITTSFQFNKLVPFYSHFQEFIKSNLYYGVTGGLIFTVNDGAISYSKDKTNPDPNYTFVSQYNYGNGIGYLVGAQVGYTYYIIPRLGINVELGARYAYVGTSETRYAHENSSYSMFYFPESIGLRYRFF